MFANSVIGNVVAKAATRAETPTCVRGTLLSRRERDVQIAADGVCLPPDSNRETALLVVPIRAATASCVSPACVRALSS
jgi:hypothetical protein